MPFSTEIRKGYLVVRHEGEISPAEAHAARIESLRLVRAHNLERMIVDVRDVTSESDPDGLREVMEANAGVKPPRPHAAVIVREDQYPRLRYIEDFAVSRGMPIRVFETEAEALAWLAG